jgi:molybdopterin-synthase adenylyltransferase
MKTSKVVIRIGEEMWTRLLAALSGRSDVESAGLLLGEPLQTTAGTVVAVREAIPIPEAAYQVRRRDQLSIDAIALNRLTRPARDRGWSIFTMHTHPGAREPWFSFADDAGDARLMPSLQCQIPNVPHGSIVVVDDGKALARTFNPDGSCHEVPIRVSGRTLTTLSESLAVVESWFARQELALGARGQQQLRHLRVGVVGLGGIGSIVALQLAHLGVGELVLMDGDRVEPSNVSRVAATTKTDPGVAYKVDVAANYAESVGLVGHVERHRVFVGPAEAPVLGSCDLLISCVDRQTPRAILNRVAYSHFIPVIDLGTVFRVDTTGKIVGEAGRVVVIGPGRPCLGCWGHLDANLLRIEALPPYDRESEILAGYIEGADEPQPSVIAFNTMVAGAGVIEVLRLVTGFAGAATPPLRLAFSFTDGTVRRNSLTSHEQCSICGSSRALQAAA